MTPREGVVLLDRADVLKALRDTLNVTDNRVTQAFGKPWLDDAASRIMAIQPAAHPAATAREEALKAMVEALTYIASHRGLTLFGDGSYSDGVFEGWNQMADAADRALALARSVKGTEA